jgi:hypothetical protein
MEERLIKNALKKYKGNITLAAEALGLTRASLYRRMEKFDLEGSWFGILMNDEKHELTKLNEKANKPFQTTSDH